MFRLMAQRKVGAVVRKACTVRSDAAVGIVAPCVDLFAGTQVVQCDGFLLYVDAAHDHPRRGVLRGHEGGADMRAHLDAAPRHGLQ